MGFPVYDFRTDVRNILVTPQIRSRFLRMEPGTVSQSHTHDLGHEIFLILAGRCEFTIDGEMEELGPGQMCVALVDQHHSVRVIGDEPMTMYLSVTPHIQPTHTYWTENGEKAPPRFIPNSAYDLPLDRTTPTVELLERCIEAANSLAEAVAAHTQVQHAMAEAFIAALAAGDQTGAQHTRNAMWDALERVYTSSAQLGEVWNAFASRTVDDGA